MALADRFPVHQAPIHLEPSFQTEPFDIDVLCAKLEVAKLEQDAERARQRLRHLTGRSRNAPSESRSQCAYPPQTDNTVSTYAPPRIKKRSTTEPQLDVRPKSLYTALSFGNIQRETRSKDERLDHSRRSSTGEIDAPRPRLQNVIKRKSVAFANQFDTTPITTANQLSSVGERPGSKDMANRRSKTFPSPQAIKLPLKHRSMTGYDYLDTVVVDAKPSRDDHSDSSMGLVNEYTISFDLADYPRATYSRAATAPECTRSKSRPDREKPIYANGGSMRSRSMLNLALLLKKDNKTQVKTEEVNLSPPAQESPVRPLTAANGHHARQKSLPPDSGKDSPTSPKLESRESKRRSFVGWLKRI